MIGRWPDRLVRFGMLLVGLTVVAIRVSVGGLFGGAFRNETGANAGAAPRGNAWAAGCPARGAPAVATISTAELVSLRTDLRRMMRGRHGDLYEVGGIGSENAWTDNDPVEEVISNQAHAREPGAYEMRWWAPNGDDIVADAFVFATAARAGDFFMRAASPSCRRLGLGFAAATPSGARDLLWLNPDQVLETDVWLVRGDRVYRVVDAPRWDDSLMTSAGRHVTFGIVNRLACSLAEARCLPTALWTPSTALQV